MLRFRLALRFYLLLFSWFLALNGKHFIHLLLPLFCNPFGLQTVPFLILGDLINRVFLEPMKIFGVKLLPLCELLLLPELQALREEGFVLS